MTEFKYFTEKVNDIADAIITNNDCDHADIIHIDDAYVYVPTGEELCWKCTLKHLGAAWEYASEIQKYPHHFIKCIGALVAASRECPSAEGRTLLYEFYNECLMSNVVEDMNTLLKDIHSIYTESL